MSRFWQRTLCVFAINFIIAFGFYLEHQDSGYSALSSDVHNIIPVAQKFDNPELFKDDLYLNTLDNVRYYTPFFVQPLRFFASLTDYNYLQGVNLFGFFCHLLFGVLWYFLIYRFTKNFWVALGISILMRGVVWLPGYEIWGISDIWTIMPRTVYIALMPLPFLLLSQTHKVSVLISAILIGLIFNFHPITGLGGILVYLCFILVYYYYYKNEITLKFNLLPLVLLGIVLGMLPFVLTYFTKTGVQVDYDVALYKEAFSKRIPPYFQDPLHYLKQWLNLKTLFYVIPLVLLTVMTYKKKEAFKKTKVILIITLSVILCSSLSFYVERFVNSVFDLNIRMAFQLIRLQKLAILPTYFAMAFLALHLAKRNYFLQGITVVFLLTLTVVKSNALNNIPFLGDDVLRGILPNTLSTIKSENTFYNETDDMLAFINTHTEEDAVFYGFPIIRSATKRSVVLDYKGASMIIEGNPAQFIQWYKETKAMDPYPYPDRIDLLKARGIDYFVTTRVITTKADLLYKAGKLNLYKIK